MAFLDYRQDGHIVTLTMNAPEMRNALSGPEAVADFVACCARINADPSVRVAILTGAGPVFSAGGDVKAMLKGVNEGQESAEAIQRMFAEGVHRISLSVYYLEVPLIAAVNGAAVGAGMDVACMCDMRIASTAAKFAESFVKMGLVAGDGGSWLLPRLIGRSRASELAFTGEMIDAHEALRLGIVSSVVEPGELMNAANDLAARIAANPGKALRLTKQLIRESDDAGFRKVLESSSALQAVAMNTQAHGEAVRAFVEKRKPVFGDE